jgi:hypothetical protein
MLRAADRPMRSSGVATSLRDVRAQRVAQRRGYKSATVSHSRSVTCRGPTPMATNVKTAASQLRFDRVLYSALGSHTTAVADDN